MPLKAYEEIAGELLAFPIGGKLYTVRAKGINDGRRLSGVLAGTEPTLAEMSGDDLWKLALGPVWDEMLADDVPAEAVAKAGFAALADHQYGRETAIAIWETDGSPEALAARVAAHTSTSTSITTPSPAGTTSRKTTPRASKRASVGKRSSSSGH